VLSTNDSTRPLIRYHSAVTPLVPVGKPEERSLDELRAQLADLEAALHERRAEMSRVKGELEAFKLDYRLRVGRLHEELDELEIAIAGAELGELAKQVDARPAGPGAASTAPMPDPVPRYTSDAVRRLFRDVAKIIHPDLAADEITRNRRHALMIEANRAYASGDEVQLRWVLEAWENSADAVQGASPEATRMRLVRRIGVVEDQLARLSTELQALESTPLWQLKKMVDDGAARGRDLVKDMVARLTRDIMVAKNGLEAMRPPGRN
jgi:hypothetical protein